MGGSRGLMGPEAFAQLRAMVDKLLSKKVDDTAEGVSAALNRLTTGSDTPSDADYYICQYARGGTSKTTYHRRPVSALWSYIKGKGGCGLCGQVARPFRVRRAVLPAPREHRQRDARARRLHGGGALPERVPAALRNQARVLERRRGHVARLRHGRRAQAQARVDAEPEKRLQARRAQRLGGARRHAARHLRAVRRAVRLVQSALVWVSTNGGSDLLCGVETSTIGAKGTWVERVAPVEMGGWSGPNVVDLPWLTFGGFEGQTATRTDGASRSPRRRTFPGRPRRCSPSTSTAQACGTP